MDTQKMIDDAVEEFRKKLEKEFIELTGTKFECIDTKGELFIADAKEVMPGTLITVDDWVLFRILETPDQKSWITYTHSQFANLMRNQPCTPKIIHVVV